VCLSDVEFIAFSDDDGSVRRMAVVRRAIAREFDRYRIGEPIASGGMATVYLGRLIGPAGFSRTVAIKRLHAYLAAEGPEFVNRFVDEARIAARVRHANVVPTLDVVAKDDELLLVLEYVHGESLSRLRKMAGHAGERMPPQVASAIVVGALRGLHAAHEATSEDGAPLDIVHRDVSPQNILVGVDGVARVLDFGIAKAAGRLHETHARDIKGKLAYMAPEQVSGECVDRRSDLFAAGVVLWEVLSGERLFREEDALATMNAIFTREPPLLARTAPGLDDEIDTVLARALAKDASMRFTTAQEMARALEAALPTASDREVAEWLERIAGWVLTERAKRIAAFEREDASSSDTHVMAAQDAVPSSRRDALAPPPMHEDSIVAVGPEIIEVEMPTTPAANAYTSDLARAPLSTMPFGDPSTVSAYAPEILGLKTPEPMILSDTTRPLVLSRSRVRTPIPMPQAMQPNRSPITKIALIALVPAAVAAMGILAVNARGTNAEPIVPVAAAAPPEAQDVPPPVVTLTTAAPPTPPPTAMATAATPSATPPAPHIPPPRTTVVRHPPARVPVRR
jgi:serine/threonine-protein kinase